MVDGFVPGPRAELVAQGHGLLDNTCFAVKDNIDVAGVATGAGNPHWCETHEIPCRHAPAVDQLLDNGSSLVGKTITEELAYSVIGHNEHFGVPRNSASPGCFCGGSSSGSASVVASGEADFALGTDTAGSIRIPASNCGLYGMRPSHGRVSSAGVVPLASSFDVVGWLSTSPQLMQKVGDVLLPFDSGSRSDGVFVYKGAFEALAPELQSVFEAALKTSGLKLLGTVELGGSWRGQGLSPNEVLRVLQAKEAWDIHGAWLDSASDGSVSPDILERFHAGRDIDWVVAERATKAQQQLRDDLATLLADYPVIAFPTVSLPPLSLGANEVQQFEYRKAAMQVTCVSSLTGTPELSLPLVQQEGWRMGISLLGAFGSDKTLLDLAVQANERSQ